MPVPLGKVDHSSLRVNQAMIILGLLAAFVLNLPWLTAAVALVMLIGTGIRRPGFFFIYLGLLRPTGIVPPGPARGQSRAAPVCAGVRRRGCRAFRCPAVPRRSVRGLGAFMAGHRAGGAEPFRRLLHRVRRLLLAQSSAGAGVPQVASCRLFPRDAAEVLSMVMTGTLVRLALALVLIAGIVGTYRAVTAFVLSRAGKNDRGLLPFRPGTPGVVFFTTPDCVTCKAAQRPALAELADRMPGSVQVIEVDALDNAVLAREWSVLSVPDDVRPGPQRDPSAGQPRFRVNGEAARSDRRAANVSTLGGELEAAPCAQIW